MQRDAQKVLTFSFLLRRNFRKETKMNGSDVSRQPGTALLKNPRREDFVP